MIYSTSVFYTQEYTAKIEWVALGTKYSKASQLQKQAGYQ